MTHSANGVENAMQAKPLTDNQQAALTWARANSPFNVTEMERAGIHPNTMNSLFMRELVAWDYETQSYSAVVATAPSYRLLTRDEVHAALRAPESEGEFNGTTCVQMTWQRFNEWAERIQREVLKLNGIDGVGAPSAAPDAAVTRNGGA